MKLAFILTGIVNEKYNKQVDIIDYGIEYIGIQEKQFMIMFV